MAFFKSKKTMWIIGGVLALAGVGAYIYYKSRKPKKEVEQTTEEVLKDVFDNLNFEFGKASFCLINNKSDFSICALHKSPKKNKIINTTNFIFYRFLQF